MRIRWRGLELPGSVARDEAVSTDVYGRFTVEPFEQGFGSTIGNSLRRVLLSSLEGAAITSVKIDGVAHEFACIDGVLEDVTDIILNIKGIVVAFVGEGSKTMTVERTSAGEVRAGDIVTDPAVTIVNPEHLIATLTDDVHFKAEFVLRAGRGYATASEHTTPEQELGVIPIDAVFSPVLRVRYRTENMRVGQRTNYDQLILEVWTDGTISPEDALVEAGLILRKHLNPFVLYHEMGEEMVAPSRLILSEARSGADTTTEEFLDKPVSVLDLSVRARNCLEGARITTLRHLVQHTVSDLLRCRSFGKTSLQEVETKLADVGLCLGMKVGTESGGLGTSPISPDGGVSADRESVTFPSSGPPASGVNETPPADDTEGSQPSSESGPMAAHTVED